jgi:hypothetical protein
MDEREEAVRRVRPLVKSYAKLFVGPTPGEKPDQMHCVAYALADLLHFAEAHGIEFEAALTHAREQYDNEAARDSV